MPITLCFISGRMQPYAAELFDTQQKYTVIYGVELDTERLISLDPGILYIASSEDSYRVLLESDSVNILYAAPSPAAAADAVERFSSPNISKNLILLKNDACGAAVYHELKEVLRAWRTYNLICEKFHNILLLGCGLQELLDTAYPMLGNPFALCDMSFTLIAAPRLLKSEAPVAEFLATYDGKSGFSACYDIYRNKRRFEEVNQIDYPQLVIEQEIDEDAYIISNIRINGQLAAFISVFEYERPFHEFEPGVILQILSLHRI